MYPYILVRILCSQFESLPLLSRIGVRCGRRHQPDELDPDRAGGGALLGGYAFRYVPRRACSCLARFAFCCCCCCSRFIILLLLTSCVGSDIAKSCALIHPLPPLSSLLLLPSPCASFALRTHAAGGTPRKCDYSNVATAVFSSPPLATVGITEEEAAARPGKKTLVFESEYGAMKHAMTGRGQ